MAVIGHAEIVVTAITKNFEKQLKQSMGNINKNTSSRAGRAIGDGFADGFNRSRANNMFGKLSDGLRSMVPEAEMARKRFQSLMRTGYTLSGVLALIAGAISSVVVSIGPLVGSLLKAAPAGAALANVFTTLTVAMRVAKWAFGDIASAVSKAISPNQGLKKSLEEIREEFQQLQFDAEEAALSEERATLNLEKAMNNLRRVQDLPPNSTARKNAELEVKEAELALRRARDRAADLRDQVAKGPDALQPTGGGGDPFAGLNKYQREFAEYLVSLSPKFKALEEELSKAFLTPLKGAVEILMKELFPILEKRLPAVAGAVGDAMKGIAVQLSTPANAKKLDDILIEMLPNIDLIGQIFGNIADILLSIIDSTSEIANDWLTAIRDRTDDWAKSLTDMNADGSLAQFFKDAAEEAKKWWVVVQNVLGGFGNLIKLTTGPGSAGEEMLIWFTEASAAFKNMFAEDPDAGKKFFLDAMINARSVLGAIGDFIKALFAVADNPNIKVAFDTLAKGAPAFESILDSIIDGAPSFAEFLVTIIEIIDQLTDADQISAFFDTLNEGAKGFKGLLDQPAIKALLDNLGPLFATLSALGVLIDVVVFAFQVLVGYAAFFFLKVSGAFTPLINVLKNVKGGLGGVAGMVKGAGWVAVIVALIALIIDFYGKFEDFRVMIDTTLTGLGDAFGNVIGSIMGLIDTLFGGDGIGGIISILEPVIKNVLMVIIPFIGGVLEFLLNGISTVIDFVTSVVKSVMDVIQPMVRGIMAILSGDLLGGIVSIAMGVVNIIVGAVQGVINGVISGVNVVIDLINGFLATINNSGIAQQLGWGQLKLTKINLVDFTGQVNSGMRQWLNRRSSVTTAPANFTSADRASRNMALGGTVFPSEGGTIVRVAEAGRPERIEPLDPNGLSKRDMALIEKLGGGGGGATINVYPSAGMDERELAEMVSRKLAFEIRKGAF
jgi:phage-related protein